MQPAADRIPPAIATARANVLDFAAYTWRDYQRPAHINLIGAALMDVFRYIRTKGREGTRNLLIELPVRHGKSVTVARFFPAYVMGALPNTRVIVASYGESLAVKHSRAVRNLIASPMYRRVFPGVSLATDSQAKDAWDLAPPHEGGLTAAGVGSGIAGLGANLIITDDLVSGRADAESATKRDSTWDWFTDDLLTRAEPRAAHVSIGTTWHLDDVHARIKRNEAQLWRIIRLPALAEDDDPLGRAPGEALWPERFDVAALEEQRGRQGDYGFSALYQQRPIPSEGGLFKRAQFNIIHSLPADLDYACRFWDLAMSSKTSADPTAGVCMAKTGSGRYVIVDVQRTRLEWGIVGDLVEQTALQIDGDSVRVGIEDVAFMTRAIQDLAKRPNMARYSITGYKPSKDKVTRALPFAARVNAGLVDVYQSSWTDAYLDELCSFPLGKHDDQVDATSGAYEMLEGYSAHVDGYRYEDTSYVSPLGYGAY